MNAEEIAKLKELAEAANPEIQQDREYFKALEAYQKAANPAAVLELIAFIDELDTPFCVKCGGTEICNEAERTTSPVATTLSTASQAPAVNAREEARKHIHSLTARTTELVGQVIAKGMLGVLEECIEMQLRMNALEARATAAEAKLEAIRMAIDGLARFYTVGDEPVEYPDSDFLMYKDVSALFQPQPQADESGLPG